ncbi:S-layer protein, partial [filamentous cyanobacterium CCP2]
GAGAAAGVSAVTGDRAIATEEVLGGAGLGALAGLFLGRNRVTLIAIDPEADLELTLNSPFVVQGN